jgi:RNA polymerase sigma factor (sigma-70 family)
MNNSPSLQRLRVWTGTGRLSRGRGMLRSSGPGDGYGVPQTPSDRETDPGRLYALHRQGLYTLALSVTGRPDRAEDAVHDAFARVCRNRGTLETAADPVAYVYAAVRNAALDCVRRQRLPAEPPASIFNGHVPGPEALALGAERERSVAEAVEGLPDAQREVVVLRVYGGLTFAQIASVVGEPLQTVATRYRRALERLKRRLEKLV